MAKPSIFNEMGELLAPTIGFVPRFTTFNLLAIE
jgi:hypothetical protein